MEEVGDGAACMPRSRLRVVEAAATGAGAAAVGAAAAERVLRTIARGLGSQRIVVKLEVQIQPPSEVPRRSVRKGLYESIQNENLIT